MGSSDDFLFDSNRGRLFERVKLEGSMRDY
jgi:hypothetical protein